VLLQVEQCVLPELTIVGPLTCYTEGGYFSQQEHFMKDSIKDNVKGAAHGLKGTVKEALGPLPTILTWKLRERPRRSAAKFRRKWATLKRS